MFSFIPIGTGFPGFTPGDARKIRNTHRPAGKVECGQGVMLLPRQLGRGNWGYVSGSIRVTEPGEPYRKALFIMMTSLDDMRGKICIN